MPALPLVSSKEACAALERLGFVIARTATGTHQAYRRARADGGSDTIIVLLNKNPIPRGTLRSMLRTGNVTEGEFVAALR